tara:strand:+ start:2711 stop:3439 length:729 start_codon:yes stop_codon:yes gene_type:complete
MHFVFLAAGKGTRIFSKIKTNKCLIKISNKTIIEKLIENIPENRRNKITIATGFNSKNIFNKTKKFKVKYIHNSKYNTTDMVETLRIALEKIDDDIFFSYTDVIYERTIIDRILKKNIIKITVPINSAWKSVWKIRNKPILKDAESLLIKNNNITEIGKKIKDIRNVHGQFMGILIIPQILRSKILKKLRNKKYKKYQTTRLLNTLIKDGFKVQAIKLKTHWYEFDDYHDLENYKKYYKIKN